MKYGNSQSMMGTALQPENVPKHERVKTSILFKYYFCIIFLGGRRVGSENFP